MQSVWRLKLVSTVFVFAALVLLAGGSPVRAQMYQCPPPSVSVSGGDGMMCMCPDGSYASIYGCASTPPPPPPEQQQQVGDYCQNGGTCPIGYQCTSDSRCMPRGHTECGNHSCGPGSY